MNHREKNRSIQIIFLKTEFLKDIIDDDVVSIAHCIVHCIVGTTVKCQLPNIRLF